MKTLTLALLSAALLGFFLGPFAFQIAISLRGDTLSSPISLAAFESVLARGEFVRALGNSLLVAFATTLTCLMLGASCAFAIAKVPFRGRRILLGAALAVSVFPPIATVSPLYLGLRAVGLGDSLAALVLTYSTFALPMTLWLLTSYFEAVPDALYRAARVDGCTPLQAFRWVFLPLVGPGLSTTALLVFIFAWNEFLFALTFVSSPAQRTVPVAISLFAGEHREPWAEISAASLVATLPLVLLTILFQRRIVSGLTAGGVKE